MNLHLPADYVCNEKPSPCDDVDHGDEWQVGVYEIVRAFDKPVIDIGCGRARKLRGHSHPVTGYDRPETVRWLLDNEPWGTWNVVDLEHPNLAVDTSGHVIVCSDVIEHLVRPEPLLTWLAAQNVPVVLSTPDREIWRGTTHRGPPPNTEHVREWSHAEFSKLVADVFAGKKHEVIHTRTRTTSDAKNTLTAIIGA